MFLQNTPLSLRIGSTLPTLISARKLNRPILSPIGLTLPTLILAYRAQQELFNDLYNVTLSVGATIEFQVSLERPDRWGSVGDIYTKIRLSQPLLDGHCRKKQSCIERNENLPTTSRMSHKRAPSAFQPPLEGPDG
ncbi:hypothetical protein V1477_000097 [Vespula maculifrons]|uniref:Uncharacterized protein n=1 Tax=Vespula maculifrons TaxID=7453 RepID=A0ABD2D2R5_VESMC